MLTPIFLAVLNGAIIGTNRALNGRLSIEVGPFRASFWNHFIGFVFITLFCLFIGDLNLEMIAKVPNYTYLGGIFGALFVGVASYVFPKLGATQSSLLIISGQMISSVVLDWKSDVPASLIGQIFGIALIFLGICIAEFKK